jgi:hypothetical protein
MAVVRLVLGIGLLAHGVAGALELTKDNFEAEALNGGKNAFVKFLAPW